MKKTKAKKILINKLIPFLIIVSGLSVALLPWINNYLYGDRVSEVVTEYDKETDSISDDGLNEMFLKAQKYNESLKDEVKSLKDPFSEDVINQMSEKYTSLISLKSGLMGYITIPAINIKLPFYHGCSANVLNKGIGHMEGTSIPIGGNGCHSVLTGHTGLNDKKLFTDLEQMKKGDYFFIKILNRKLAYKVVNINVVLPEDTSAIFFDDNRDLCTLITCTPYGINDHRLLVTGERTEYIEGMEDTIPKSSYSSSWKQEYLKYIIFGLLLAIIIVIIAKTTSRIRGAHEKKD